MCGNRSSWSLSSTFSALPSWIHSFLFCFQLLYYYLLPAPAPSPSSLPLVVAGALLILDPSLIWLQVVLCLVHHFFFWLIILWFCVFFELFWTFGAWALVVVLCGRNRFVCVPLEVTKWWGFRSKTNSGGRALGLGWFGNFRLEIGWVFMALCLNSRLCEGPWCCGLRIWILS